MSSTGERGGGWGSRVSRIEGRLRTGDTGFLFDFARGGRNIREVVGPPSNARLGRRFNDHRRVALSFLRIFALKLRSNRNMQVATRTVPLPHYLVRQRTRARVFVPVPYSSIARSTLAWARVPAEALQLTGASTGRAYRRSPLHRAARPASQPGQHHVPHRTSP